MTGKTIGSKACRHALHRTRSTKRWTQYLVLTNVMNRSSSALILDQILYLTEHVSRLGVDNICCPLSIHPSTRSTDDAQKHGSLYSANRQRYLTVVGNIENVNQDVSAFPPVVRPIPCHHLTFRSAIHASHPRLAGLVRACPFLVVTRR